LDTANPCSFGQLVTPAFYMEMRHDIDRAMDMALVRFDEIEEEYARIFKRRYGAVEAIQCDDADIILLTSGTVTSTCRLVLKTLRDRGEKVGILKVKLFRPTPVEKIRGALKSAKKVAVVDRNSSFGAGGIFAQEVRAALCNLPGHPLVYGYIAGIGGRDVTPELLEEIYWKTKNSEVPEKESVWMGLQEVAHGTQRS
jgi:pyruvate/2-oxoacid:ferredoxin oxidoreductase alpha subunit